ncbi:hypothetical protein CDD82_7694 [Ophiocordyceps australis]|uniref:Uncharacterized protein n=1 Tax=Ophiocordyceps australis TaxID=1399860 RepID=A0A2C5YR93_9HYPO|nr:hypothetical protein CDD82_7694 [Ophiocordyceps australis]
MENGSSVGFEDWHAAACRPRDSNQTKSQQQLLGTEWQRAVYLLPGQVDHGWHLELAACSTYNPMLHMHRETAIRHSLKHATNIVPSPLFSLFSPAPLSRPSEPPL